MKKSVLSLIILLSLTGCAGTKFVYPTADGPIEYLTWHPPWQKLNSEVSYTPSVDTNALGTFSMKTDRDSTITPAKIDATGRLVKQFSEGGAEGAVKGLKTGL
jgi:hypothetical protein